MSSVWVNQPSYLQVRVLDCYLVEGPKVLYRVGLAILNLFNKQSGESLYSLVMRSNIGMGSGKGTTSHSDFKFPIGKCRHKSCPITLRGHCLLQVNIHPDLCCYNKDATQKCCIWPSEYPGLVVQSK